MELFLQFVTSGILLGGVYALVALGFVLIFKGTQVVNFAQGALAMVGALFVSFLVNDEHYFPDFIIWLIGPQGQDIVFVDPHGLVIGSNLDTNAKVQFFRGIKDYETELSRRSRRTDVALHSYIVSRTPFEKLRQLTRLQRYHDFNSCNVYFQDQDRNPAAKLILRDVLEP